MIGRDLGGNLPGPSVVPPWWRRPLNEEAWRWSSISIWQSAVVGGLRVAGKGPEVIFRVLWQSWQESNVGLRLQVGLDFA